MQPRSDKAIEQRAYEIWEAEGRPDGRHLEHWERAARELGMTQPEIAKARKAATKRTKPAAGAEAPKKRKSAAAVSKPAPSAAVAEKPARAPKGSKKTEPV